MPYLLERGLDNLIQILVWYIREKVSYHVSRLGIDGYLRNVRVTASAGPIIADSIDGHHLPGCRKI